MFLPVMCSVPPGRAQREPQGYACLGTPGFVVKQSLGGNVDRGNVDRGRAARQGYAGLTIEKRREEPRSPVSTRLTGLIVG